MSRRGAVRVTVNRLDAERIGAFIARKVHGPPSRMAALLAERSTDGTVQWFEGIDRCAEKLSKAARRKRGDDGPITIWSLTRREASAGWLFLAHHGIGVFEDDLAPDAKAALRVALELFEAVKAPEGGRPKADDWVERDREILATTPELWENRTHLEAIRRRLAEFDAKAAETLVPFPAHVRGLLK